MIERKEKMKFYWVDEEYKRKSMELEYTLEFKDNKLQDVRNEYGFKVEHKSGVFDYFSKKYS